MDDYNLLDALPCLLWVIVFYAWVLLCLVVLVSITMEKVG